MNSELKRLVIQASATGGDELSGDAIERFAEAVRTQALEESAKFEAAYIEQVRLHNLTLDELRTTEAELRGARYRITSNMREINRVKSENANAMVLYDKLLTEKKALETAVATSERLRMQDGLSVARRVPAGWKLVPIELDDETIERMEDSGWRNTVKSVWAKVIAASPTYGEQK